MTTILLHVSWIQWIEIRIITDLLCNKTDIFISLILSKICGYDYNLFLFLLNSTKLNKIKIYKPVINELILICQKIVEYTMDIVPN